MLLQKPGGGASTQALCGLPRKQDAKEEKKGEKKEGKRGYQGQSCTCVSLVGGWNAVPFSENAGYIGKQVYVEVAARMQSTGE
jgi:hypothetical protein